MPKGLQLCLYEGYRSLATQKLIFNQFFYKIKHKNPEWESSKVHDEACRLVSPITNQDGSKNRPPHATGGAVDLYLINDEGVVDMGIKAEDWTQDTDGSLSKTDSTIISDEAIRHRIIMSEALTAVGLVNYPNEYWHWSYGDRLWAYYLGKPCALYDILGI